MEHIRKSIMENQSLSEKDIKLSTSIGIEFVNQEESTEVLLRNTLEALCIAKGNDEGEKIVIYKKSLDN